MFKWLKKEESLRVKIWQNEEVLLKKTLDKVNALVKDNQLVFIITWFPKYTSMVGEYLLERNIVCRVLTQEDKLTLQDRQKVFITTPDFFDNTEAFKQFYSKSIIKRVNFIFWGLHPLYSENIKRLKESKEIAEYVKSTFYLSYDNYILKNFLQKDIEEVFSQIESSEDESVEGRRIGKSFESVLKNIESIVKNNEVAEDYEAWFELNYPDFK